MKILLVSCFALLYFQNYTFAASQTLDSAKTDTVQNVRENWYWLQAGWFFVGYAAAASVAIEHHIFKVRYAGFGTTTFAPVTPSTNDISMLYGVITRGDWAFASASAGIGYTYGVILAADFRTGIPFTTVGLAWEAHAAVKAYAVGLGLTVLGNLNLHQSEVRYLVTVHLGWMP